MMPISQTEVWNNWRTRKKTREIAEETFSGTLETFRRKTNIRANLKTKNPFFVLTLGGDSILKWKQNDILYI